MSEKIPEFTNINFYVCNYCSHLIIPEVTTGKDTQSIYGCDTKKNDKDLYARLTDHPDDVKALINQGIDALSRNIGCEKFEPSSIPIHPYVLEQLVELNELIRNAPVDEKALETSWEFMNKVSRYLTRKELIFSRQIQ